MVRRGGEGLTDLFDAPETAADDATETATEPSGPERRCIATGRVLPKAALIRFVVDPDGAVVPDLTERLPGRGLWVAAEHDALHRAVERNLFARAARQPVKVPPDLIERIVALLRQSCVNLVAMARRAGQAVAGYEKVRAHLGAGHAMAARGGVLLVARDGGRDSRGKAAGQAAARPDLRVVDVLDGDSLGAAFGRDRVVHVLMERGGIAERLRAETARLAGVANLAPADEGGGRDGRSDDIGGTARRKPDAGAATDGNGGSR